MARLKKTPPTAASLANLRSLPGTYGRGGALIAAAWLDDALEGFLLRYLSRDAALARDLFHADGPLGTFGVRIKVAYLLGLISDDVRKDLDLIRAVRNDFAHIRDRVGFDTPSIAQRCRQLKAYRLFASSARDAGRTPRQRYITAAALLAAALIDVTDRTPVAESKSVSLDDAVRSVAMSRSFRQLIQPYYAERDQRDGQ